MFIAIQNSRRDEDAERGRNLFCLNTMETKKETQGKEGKKKKKKKK